MPDAPSHLGPPVAARSSQYWTLEVSVLATVLAQLVVKLPCVPLEACTDLFESISYCTGPLVASIIHQELHQYIKQGIMAFRALVIYHMTESRQSWPLLQWKEDGVDVIVIFDLDKEKPENCSWLMGRITGKGLSARVSLAWNVQDMSTLKTLFQAAQQLVGILEMPKNDAVKLYCEGETDCSNEQYASFLVDSNLKDDRTCASSGPSAIV